MSRFTRALAAGLLRPALFCSTLWVMAIALVACGQAKPGESTKTAQSEVEASRPRPASARSEPSDAGAALAIGAEPPNAEVPPAACDPRALPSPLAQAAFEGDVEGARRLIVAAEQDASRPPHCAMTPLMMALSPFPEEPDATPSEARMRRAGKHDAAGLFLTRCFDVAGTDAHGLTALHVAMRAPDPEHKLTRLVQRMFACGAPPDPQTDEGVTPLMLAVEAKRKKLAEVLLEGGADVNLRSHAGKSALQLAEDSRDRTLIKLLRTPVVRDAGRE